MLLISFRCATFSYYSSWKKIQEDEGSLNFQKKMPYRYFRMSWYAYLQLLDFDLEQGFVCDECGPAPSMVLFDATTLGHKNIYQDWYNISPTEKRDSGR